MLWSNVSGVLDSRWISVFLVHVGALSWLDLHSSAEFLPNNLSAHKGRYRSEWDFSQHYVASQNWLVFVVQIHYVSGLSSSYVSSECLCANSGHHPFGVGKWVLWWVVLSLAFWDLDIKIFQPLVLSLPLIVFLRCRLLSLLLIKGMIIELNDDHQISLWLPN